MKKVLFVNDVYSLGGVEKSLEEALRYLDYDRMEVDLCILHPKEPPDGIDSRVRLIRIDERKCGRSLRYLWLSARRALYHMLSLEEKEDRIKDRLRQQYYNRERKLFFPKNYDYAIAYKHGETAEFVAEVIKADQKIMFYHHGGIMDYELHRRAFAKAGVIAAVSQGVAELLGEAYPEYKLKLTVIPNLIDAASIRRRAKEYSVKILSGNLKSPEEQGVGTINADLCISDSHGGYSQFLQWEDELFFTLCSCGRLNPEKGFDLAVAAAKLLDNKKLKFHWYFVGDGAARGELEESIRRLGLDSRITITGRLANPLPYLDACDIYVQPSYTEAFCLSIAEAQVLGKPVVSTATIGAKYLIEDKVTGILTGFNGESLENAISRLVSNPEQREFLIRNTKGKDYSRNLKEYKEQWMHLLE